MKARPALAVGVLVTATLLSSGHRFANDFVFDAVDVIEEGSVIHDFANLGAVWTHHTMFASTADQGSVQSVDTYRPVPITLFLIDSAIGGGATWPYHLTNLLLHLLCVVGVFWAALRWLDDLPAALYGALVFAVHPWAVEAHVWINGRSDPASLAFGLAGMIALLSAEQRRSIGLYVAAGASFLVGLLCKETLLLVFPAILLMPPAKGGARSTRGRLVPLAAAGLAYLAARAAVLGGMQTHRDAAMLGDAARNLPWLLLDGLRQSVAPERPYLRSLRDEYASLPSWQIALAALALIALAALAIRARRRAPLAAWSALFFFPPLIPIAIISTVLWPGFGRYLYIPLAGFAWLIAALTPWARGTITLAPVRVALAGLHVVLLAALAALFTRDFASSELLYGGAIRARPDVAMGYGWLGLTRARRGDHEGSIVPLLRAATLDPDTHRYLLHAGEQVLLTGDRANAEIIAERGIRRFEGRPEEASYHLLAVNSMSERDPGRAVAHLVRCTELRPARRDCGEALAGLLHDPIEGEANRAAFDRALAARPELAPLFSE